MYIVQEEEEMKKLIIFVTMLLFVVACTAKPVEDCVAVEFTKAYSQNIDYGHLSGLEGLSQKTISFWVNFDDLSATTNVVYIAGNGGGVGDEAWGLVVGYGNVANSITFAEGFSAGIGQGSWRIAGLSTGTNYHIAITYDRTNIANDPIFMVNGTVVSPTELDTPSGSALTGTGSQFRLGDALVSSPISFSLDGKLQDVRIYNRILSTNEIETLANSKCLKTVMNGLVFWAPMWGTNDQSFDGLTLTSSHRIADWVTDAVGTPAGSPIGRGNTIQPLK